MLPSYFGTYITTCLLRSVLVLLAKEECSCPVLPQLGYIPSVEQNLCNSLAVVVVQELTAKDCQMLSQGLNQRIAAENNLAVVPVLLLVMLALHLWICDSAQIVPEVVAWWSFAEEVANLGPVETVPLLEIPPPVVGLARNLEPVSNSVQIVVFGLLPR